MLPSFGRNVRERQTKDLTSQIKDLQKAKEALLREVNELKTQLKMAEESRDGVRRELIDAHRKIREGQTYLVCINPLSTRPCKLH